MKQQKLSSPKTKLNYRTLTLGAASFAVLFSLAYHQDAKAKTEMVVKDPPSPGVVARINGEDITETELFAESQGELMQIEKEKYDLKMNLLNKLIADRLFSAEAKKEKLSSADEYVQKKILKDEIKVSDSEFEKFVKENNIPQDKINPDVKEHIYNYLKDQKRQQKLEAQIAKLTKKNAVEIYFQKPRSNLKVEVGDAPVSGGANAKVTIVEFSDFQCPYCGQAAKTVSEIKKKYGDKIQFAFKQFPLPATMHKDAFPAAEASMCVNEQGKEKFWKFHDLAFKGQDRLDADSLAKYAKEAGADPEKFKACFSSHEFADYIKKDQAYGEKIGVHATPTFIVNGQIVNGALTEAVLSGMIDDELVASAQ